MLLISHGCPVCAKYSVISPVPLICLKATEKITNVEACQNISRTPNVARGFKCEIAPVLKTGSINYHLKYWLKSNH